MKKHTIGTAAYLWGFTMNELYRVRNMHLSQEGVEINKFDHKRALTTPEMARKLKVVRPNGATIYSLAWLDRSVGLIVLEIPPMPDRYFTLNYVDYYQNNENISNRCPPWRAKRGRVVPGRRQRFAASDGAFFAESCAAIAS